MTKLAKITKLEEKLITQNFPSLRNTLEQYAEEHLADKVAVSVFESWLGKENLHLLECKTSQEREERNARMLCLWESLFDLTDVYTYESKSQKADSQDIAFMRYLDKETYLKDCAYHGDKSSEDFQFIILPEFQAIYYENWDDTNVLWFVSKGKIGPILQKVSDCGLYIIEYIS